jgi:hypothetical protein
MFLEDILEKTSYKIKSERENFQGNSRRKRPVPVKNDPVSDVFEVNQSLLTILLMSVDHVFTSLRRPIFQTL